MQRGYEAVSLEMIAESASITKAAIYYYFPTKADVFTAAVEWLLSVIHRESQKILRGPEPFRDRLRQLTKTRLAVAESHFDFDRVLLEAQDQLNEEQRAHIDRVMQALTDLLQEAARQAYLAGEPVHPDPVFFAHAYMALLNVAYARGPEGTRVFSDRNAVAESIVSLLVPENGT
jgi:AcrR family transcriptional regulator